MSGQRYTVYSVLADGNPWNVLTTENPLEALAALKAERETYANNRHHHHGIFDQDDPERGDIQNLLEEEIEASLPDATDEKDGLR